MVDEIKDDNLSEVISENDTVFVQFMASWCGNCRLMKPKFKKMARENEDAKFLFVDAEKNPESRKLATVDNLPTFAAYKGGEFLDQVQTNKLESLKTLVDETTQN